MTDSTAKTPALWGAETVLNRLQERGHVLRDYHGNTGPVMKLEELFEIINEAILKDRELRP